MPLFLHREMLTESEVKALVETWLAGYTADADFFVERVEVAGDAVRVYIDRDAGIGLEECAAGSRGVGRRRCGVGSVVAWFE